MADISPQAQAVKAAAIDAWGDPRSTVQGVVAAALRAVVAECPYTDDYGSPYINGDDLLAIAAELEAGG
jgi:uncharacterized protein YfaS (alpha-2-macroglobulin family)